MFDPVKDYALKVLDGKIVAGPSVRAACRRHLRDLDTASSRGLWFDLEAAQFVFDFFEETLAFKEGQFDDLPFLLQPPQQFILGSTFGWKADDGSRRFNTAYIEQGKGNGKTPTAAGVGLFLFCADDEAGAEIYFGGPTKAQSRIAFDDVIGFVDRNPQYLEEFRKVGENPIEELHYKEMGSKMIPVSSDGLRKSGFRPSGIIVDEVHELGRDGSLITTLRKGFKGRRNPLLLMITNSGFDRQSVCWSYHEYATKAAAGVAEQSDDEQPDQFFSFVCDLDEGDDPIKDESCWPKANPLLEISMPKKTIRTEVKEAKGMPHLLNDLKRLNFCIWTTAAAGWMKPHTWSEVIHDITADEREYLRSVKCRGAIDLSKKNDLTALTLAFDLPEATVVTLSWFLTPEEGIDDRAKRDGAIYHIWAKENKPGTDEPYLITTPGPEVDYAVLAELIKRLDETYQIEYLCFDPYKIEDLKKELDKIDCKVKLLEHLQGARKTRQTGFWMPGAIQNLESAIVNRKIIIEDNPVMTMCALSAEAKTIDDQGNRIFSKLKSTKRIDGVVTLAMAANAVIAGPTVKKKKSLYAEIAERRKAERAAEEAGAEA